MLRRINWSLFSLFLICLFPLMLSIAAQPIPITIGLLIQLILLFKKGKRFTSRGIWFPFMMSLPFVILTLSLFYTQNLEIGLKYLERQIMMLLLPWILFLNRDQFSQQTQDRVLNFFAICMSGLTLYVFTLMLLTGKFFSIIQLPNSYYYIREFLGQKLSIHPTYFSILLSIAFFSMLYELLEDKKSRVTKWAKSLVLVVLFLGLVVATSKMIIIASFFGSAIILYYKWGIRSGNRLLLMPLVLIVTLFFTVTPLRDRATELIKALTEAEVDRNNPDSMRKAIYHSSFAAIKDNPLIGEGIGDVQSALNKKYSKLGYVKALEEDYNTHSYYLHFWLASGVFGFLAFTAIQLIQLLVAIVNRNPVHVAVIVVFSLSMFTENILSRQVGVFTYSFFTAFLAYCSWSRHKNKIVINGRFLTQSLTGVQRYAREISKHLLTEHNNFKLLSPKGAEKIQSTQESLPFFKGIIGEQLILPFYLKLQGSPFLLNLCNSAPICYSYNYITIHDVAFMENKDWFTKNFSRWYRFMMPKILKKANSIFTVSDFSKSELVKYFAIPSDKIMVTYNGIPVFSLTENEDSALIEGDYALTVGSLSARKNQEFIINCFTEMTNEVPLKLVLAGNVNNFVLGEANNLQMKIRDNTNIIWIKQPTDAELQNLYKNAYCTLYMSHYEGFGLPVLESLVYGKITIVSDIEVFRELFDDLVLYSSPENHSQFISVLKNCLQPSYLSSFSTPKLSQLEERFSYERSASLIYSQLTSC